MFTTTTATLAWRRVFLGIGAGHPAPWCTQPPGQIPFDVCCVLCAVCCVLCDVCRVLYTYYLLPTTYYLLTTYLLLVQLQLQLQLLPPLLILFRLPLRLALR